MPQWATIRFAIDRVWEAYFSDSNAPSKRISVSNLAKPLWLYPTTAIEMSEVRWKWFQLQLRIVVKSKPSLCAEEAHKQCIFICSCKHTLRIVFMKMQMDGFAFEMVGLVGRIEMVGSNYEFDCTLFWFSIIPTENCLWWPAGWLVCVERNVAKYFVAGFTGNVRRVEM